MEKVLYYFKEISKIPRGSGNTDKIAEYCMNFAEKRGFWCKRDEYNNVIMKKPASPSFEDVPAVILQGHTDMVCEKLDGVSFDFERDSIRLIEKDGFLTADGTTLGADDGIAVAMILALFDSDLPHPALEAVLTSDEEIGMIGAMGLDMSDISGRRMINLDSEKADTFTVSCAGGIVVKAVIPLEENKVFGTRYDIFISGLPGGHSGVEIHKGYPNANILAGRILKELDDVYVLDIHGGDKDNVITPAAKVSVVADYDISEKISSLADSFNKEYPEIKINIECKNCGNGAFKAYKNTIGEFLTAVPNGVIAYSREIPGLVETSLNCGITALKSGSFCASFSLRSSVEKEKTALAEKISGIISDFGGRAEVDGDYPGWEFNPDSDLLKHMKHVFYDMFGKEPVIEAIHAGLECGIFAGKLPGLECVSISPDVFDIHTPDERLDLASTQKTWDFVKNVLKTMR